MPVIAEPTNLPFYQQQGPMTNPNEHAAFFAHLPTDISTLVQRVQGLLIHPLTRRLYNVQLTQDQHREVQIRSVTQMLARIQAITPEPLMDTREPDLRLVGNCRDHATLFTAMLRHVGIPARVRVGFARYFDPVRNQTRPYGPFNFDHWIVEYWSHRQARWVLVDPQIDVIQREAHQIDFDTLDMQFAIEAAIPLPGSHQHNSNAKEREMASWKDTDGQFYLAGRAWQLCRNGEMSSRNFGYSGKFNGIHFVRRSVLHDFTALNGVELLPWDAWSALMRKPEQEMTPVDKALVDEIAELTLAPDASFESLRTLYESTTHAREVDAKLTLLGFAGRQIWADLDTLASSDAQRLNALSSPELTATTPPPVFDPYELPEEVAANFDTQVVGLGDIIIKGARQHNLKNVDVVIPRHKLVVITGVSGSGKSSLAFDTLYAEGQRRYVESLSAYARQFLGQMEKPLVDQISGLSPAISIEQKTVSRNPRSTVGTITEVMDYLRLLYARAGTPHCPQCGEAVQPQSARQIYTQLLNLPAGTRFQLLAPIVRKRKGTHKDTLDQARKDGYTRARIDGELVDLSTSTPTLAKTKAHSISLVVDRLIIPEKSDGEFQSRLIDSVETALKAGEGVLTVDLGDEELTLSQHNACTTCQISFQPLTPRLFSFNSPIGMCPECNGLGHQLQIDPDRIIAKPHLSLLDGASSWYGNMRKKGESSWTVNNVIQIANHYGVDLETPWQDLPENFRHIILHGSGGEKLRVSYQNEDGSWSGESYRELHGIIYHINRLFRQTKSEGRKRFYMQFMSQQPCPVCVGERLCAEARYVTVGGERLPDVSLMTISDAHTWIQGVAAQLNNEQREIVEEVVNEIEQRIQFLLSVGLHYLTLDRPAPTLSGGESQRIRLASQLSCGLVGVLYILDEPSIGLHMRDHRALLDTLVQLRDMGNTVVVIEHDADTMRLADWLIDLGPGAGVMGGELTAVGTPEQVMADPLSVTGAYLSGKQAVSRPESMTAARTPLGWLTVRGARMHNLKGIDVRFPLGLFTCVTGVSGSGKSSLVSKTLHPALSRELHNAQSIPGPHNDIDGLDQINKVINITQDPIGRTPRSNPATYVGAFDEVRKIFAAVPEAKTRGYKSGRFSFNNKDGRCDGCDGHGRKRVEMHFLADVWVTCAVCGGERFNRQTLEITYRGKSIADVLEMDVQEALTFFEAHPKLHRILQTLHDVGLDYIKLGQSALTLSGGEAQRIKLAKELSRLDTGRTVYILDEPTTGLHFADIQRLLDVLHRLVEVGNSVIVIEHNLDVIKNADWLIDLGPEGGEAGGVVVAEGQPEVVAQSIESYTGQFLRREFPS
ncbi:MAG: excinuclease ABC subunit UvrA [Chloroflexota bacterium]